MTTDFKGSFDAVDQTDHRAKHKLHLNLGLIKFVQLLRKIAKMALLSPCMKFEISLAKSILLKHYENGNKKKYL